MRNSLGAPHSTERCKITKSFSFSQVFSSFLLKREISIIQIAKIPRSQRELHESPSMISTVALTHFTRSVFTKFLRLTYPKSLIPQNHHKSLTSPKQYIKPRFLSLQSWLHLILKGIATYRYVVYVLRTNLTSSHSNRCRLSPWKECQATSEALRFY